MRRLLLVLIGLPALAIGFCSLPLTSVAVLTLTLIDQVGREITAGAEARYLDDQGREIIKISFDAPSSWDNNLHWWAQSEHRQSLLRPEDARRARTVEVTTKNCEPIRLPVNLERVYEPLSFAPHGGGSAYFIYRFQQDVVMQCG